jgi:hypothetical protein
MPGWAADAQRFVEELVAIAFDVDLRSVLLAESVEHEDVRLQLTEAEKALEQEDAVGALAATLGAFDAARDAWRPQRLEGVGPLRLQYSGLNALGGIDIDPTNVSLNRFEDLSEVQPFAPDIGEYHWLLARRGEFEEHKLRPEYATAKRAFLFALAWVLRWEAFAARYESRRYPTAGPAYEPPVTGAASPSVHDISVETQHHIGSWLDMPTLENVRYLIRVTLADLPTDERVLWSAQVADVLNEAASARGFEHVGAANVGVDGIIRFHGVSSDVTGHEIRSWVESAIEEGGRRYRQKLAERRDRAAVLPTQRQGFEEALRGVDAHGVLSDVVSEDRDDGSVWVGARLRRDQEDPLLGRILDGVAHSVRSGRHGIDYFETTLWFAPGSDPSQAAAALQEVVTAYRLEGAKRQQGLEDVEARRRALEAELHAT